MKHLSPRALFGHDAATENYSASHCFNIAKHVPYEGPQKHVVLISTVIFKGLCLKVLPMSTNEVKEQTVLYR